MNKSDINRYALSDAHYLELVGDFVRNTRMEQQKTQAALAEAAGVNRTTLVNLEKGKSVNLLSLVQVLRALKRLDVLQHMEIKPAVSPLQIAALEQKERQRVRSRQTGDTGKPTTDW